MMAATDSMFSNNIAVTEGERPSNGDLGAGQGEDE